MHRYSPTHEWIKIEGNEGTVGITAYAQKELGEIVYAELPSVGDTFLVGEEIVVLESTKAAADIYSPVSGEVTEVNTALKTDLTSLNKDPETSGWLFKMNLSQDQEHSLLLEKDEYEKMIQG